MNKYTSRLFSIFVCIVFLLVSSTLAGCDNSKTVNGIAKIDSLEWEAIAEIQELIPCNENGWEVPDGAIVYNEQEEIKSYKTVGYETKYKTEEYQEHVGYYLPTWRPKYETRTRTVSYEEPIKEPVYATKYYYTIDRWVYSYNVQLSRGYTNDYSYPEYTCDENERIGEVEYRYLVHFRFNERDVSYVVSKERWEILHVGQEIYIEENQYKVLHINWDNVTSSD